MLKTTFRKEGRETPRVTPGRTRVMWVPMKILLLGASGLVGGAVARLAGPAGHAVTGVVGSWAGPAIPGLSAQVSVDLQEPGPLESLCETLRPAVIVNAAAVADPGACEADPTRSHRLNVELPVRLARLAQVSGARLIHLSSEQVFDGSAPPYSVNDRVHGINLYARQKIEAEQRVQSANPSSVILRLPLLLGNSLSTRRSAHEKLMEAWLAGRPVKLYVDEIRQCCTADSVARAILELTGRPELTGRFHWAGRDPLSRHEIGLRIRHRFGLSEQQAPIIAVTREGDAAALATRPANLSLTLAPLDTLLATKPQGADEAFAELVAPAWWRPA
jgi:dTDP-4-dehydrorhamnose reductase